MAGRLLGHAASNLIDAPSSGWELCRLPSPPKIIPAPGLAGPCPEWDRAEPPRPGELRRGVPSSFPGGRRVGVRGSR